MLATHHYLSWMSVWWNKLFICWCTNFLLQIWKILGMNLMDLCYQMQTLWALPAKYANKRVYHTNLQLKTNTSMLKLSSTRFYTLYIFIFNFQQLVPTFFLQLTNHKQSEPLLAWLYTHLNNRSIYQCNGLVYTPYSLSTSCRLPPWSNGWSICLESGRRWFDTQRR